jgi:hypothetical protein
MSLELMDQKALKSTTSSGDEGTGDDAFDELVFGFFGHVHNFFRRVGAQVHCLLQGVDEKVAYGLDAARPQDQVVGDSAVVKCQTPGHDLLVCLQQVEQHSDRNVPIDLLD